MARLTKEKWLEEGLKILSEFAQHKIRILYLCERLGVTRGSFYHHFESIDDYVLALMAHWEQQNTLGFIEATKGAKGPVEKIAVLNGEVLKANQAVEASIRSWSYYNSIVRERLVNVDRVRMEFLQGVFEEMGLPAERSVQLARLDYAVLVGTQQLFPNATEEEVRTLFETYSEIHWSQK